MHVCTMYKVFSIHTFQMAIVQRVFIFWKSNLGMCVAPENVLTGTSLCFLHILHVSVSVWAPLGRHLAVVSLRI